jgi:hypothetical protein
MTDSPTWSQVTRAHVFATGHRLGSTDFEGGKTGAVKVLEKLGFTIQAIRRSTT